MKREIQPIQQLTLRLKDQELPEVPREVAVEVSEAKMNIEAEVIIEEEETMVKETIMKEELNPRTKMILKFD